MSIYRWDVRKSVRLLTHADDELPALRLSVPSFRVSVPPTLTSDAGLDETENTCPFRSAVSAARTKQSRTAR